MPMNDAKFSQTIISKETRWGANLREEAAKALKLLRPQQKVVAYIRQDFRKQSAMEQAPMTPLLLI